MDNTDLCGNAIEAEYPRDGESVIAGSSEYRFIVTANVNPDTTSFSKRSKAVDLVTGLEPSGRLERFEKTIEFRQPHLNIF